jgi:hypothetical protein
MPKIIFDYLNFTHLAPMPIMLQLVDSMVRYPAGIAEDIPVKIRGYFIPVDFVVLDMETTKESPLILGRPFLRPREHRLMSKPEKSTSTLMAKRRSLTSGPDKSNAP